jgi:tRNA(Ile)-lysidine synthase
MVERIAGNISRYNMFQPGARVGVAVSGGADSVCLLHVLFELAPRWNLHLRVIHVEHGIRGEASRADTQFVRELAESLGLPFACRTADVPALAQETRDNLEQAARRIRHEFYRELTARGEVDRVATGHTRNDQAETVLYRILRGSGVSGVAGIRPATSDGIVRPLLLLCRGEVESWLRERHISWREDQTNADPAYLRNRIRHQLMPLLRSEYNPSVDDVLARMATLAAEDEQFWDAQIGDVPSTFEVSRIADATSALGRRIVRKAIENVKGDLRQVDFNHVEAILNLARSTEGSGRLQIPGVDVLRSFDWIRFRAPSAGPEPRGGFSYRIAPPCMIEWLEGGSISFEIRENGSSCDRLEDGLCCPGEVLELRNWQPGDRYRPAGWNHERKIKQMFQDARIPIWLRRRWPVLATTGKILWSRRFGPAAEFAATGETPCRLCICERDIPFA